MSIRPDFLKLAVILLLTVSCSKGSSHPSDTDLHPPVDTTKPVEKILTVMTYNIHRGNPPGQAADVIDLQAIANVIKAQNPDLVSLNEVDAYTKRSGKSLDEAKELGRLTGMYFYFAKAMDYDGGQYGDAVLSRYPIEDSTRYALPFAIAKSEPRDIAMITIEVGGKKILFAATHLDHLSAEDNRILQANTIIDDILPKLKYPLIIAGDLNAYPGSKTISILKKELTMGCSGNGCPFTFPYNNPDRSIDYIMFSSPDRFSFLSYKAITGMIASDHIPLVAKIKLKED